MAHKIQHLLQIKSPEQGQSQFTIPVKGASFGRESINDIVLKQGMISRQHGRFEIRGEDCYLIDLESANGITLNKQQLEPNSPTVVHDNDLITIGDFKLTYQKKVLLVEKKSEKPKTKGDVQKHPTVVSKPPPPPQIPTPPAESEEPDSENPIDRLGIQHTSLRYLEYLPGIYHTDFMSRFLALFESITLPIEWTIENFDLFLDIDLAPAEFLPWLEQWYQITGHKNWPPDQRRTFLKEAQQLYAARGTRKTLQRMLHIYTGQLAEIIEFHNENDPFSFIIKLPQKAKKLPQEQIEAIIELNKPAHSRYTLTYK